jgi:hypothetical protein
MAKGEHISVAPKSQYSIINTDPNQTTYFVMHYVNIERKLAKKRQKQPEQSTQLLAIEAPPQQTPELSNGPAMTSGDVASRRRRSRRSTTRLATEQEMEHPATRSFVARQMARSQSANTDHRGSLDDFSIE